MAIRELVVQMDINNVTDKQKAMMKAAYTGVSSVPGVNYVEVDIKDWTITVRGETFDADKVVSIIQKKWKAKTETNLPLRAANNPGGRVLQEASYPDARVQQEASYPDARVQRGANIPDASVLREASNPNECIIL